MPLDDGKNLPVALGEVDRVRHTLQALRQSRPGIVIDSNYAEFEKRYDLEPPWYGGGFGGSGIDDMHEYMQRWLHER